MGDNTRPFVILLADDDAEDRAMTRSALEQHDLAGNLYTVADGEELIDYLHHRGAFAPPALSPTPSLILLDLNMPRKDGREALREIKADKTLRHIPVVVMTTSRAHQDVERTYDLGTNSYISKPITYPELVEVMRVLGLYWFKIVNLPRSAGGS